MSGWNDLWDDFKNTFFEDPVSEIADVGEYRRHQWNKFGERKLSDQERKEIQLSVKSVRDVTLAKEYGVSSGHVYKIRRKARQDSV